MLKKKVLTLYQKAKICEMSLKPGFDKDQCAKWKRAKILYLEVQLSDWIQKRNVKGYPGSLSA